MLIIFQIYIKRAFLFIYHTLAWLLAIKRKLFELYPSYASWCEDQLS